MAWTDENPTDSDRNWTCTLDTAVNCYTIIDTWSDVDWSCNTINDTSLTTIINNMTNNQLCTSWNSRFFTFQWSLVENNII
jgi:hypothetical protein